MQANLGEILKHSRVAAPNLGNSSSERNTLFSVTSENWKGKRIEKEVESAEALLRNSTSLQCKLIIDLPIAKKKEDSLMKNERKVAKKVKEIVKNNLVNN